MIKCRLIPKLLLKSRKIGNAEKMILVTSKKFKDHISVGDPVSQAKIYQAQMADELIFLNIEVFLERRKSLFLDEIRRAAENLFMPLTAGGGVKDINDFRLLLLNGADKVCINTNAVTNPSLITEAANIFGAQCVVLAIDAKRSEDGKYKVWINCGTVPTDLDPAEWAKEGERRGAGEILLTSIDNDGTRTGLDIELTKSVASATSIPIIACGGCGLASHFEEGFIKTKANAIAASTYFCFKDENPMQIRSRVKSAGIPIRVYT